MFIRCFAIFTPRIPCTDYSCFRTADGVKGKDCFSFRELNTDDPWKRAPKKLPWHVITRHRSHKQLSETARTNNNKRINFGTRQMTSYLTTRLTLLAFPKYSLIPKLPSKLFHLPYRSYHTQRVPPSP